MTQRKRPNKEGVCVFTSLRLRNFKGYKDSGDVPLRPLTVIVGKNNSGKSTLLHALLLLKQTLDSPFEPVALMTQGPLVDLGGWYDIIHGGESGDEKTVGLSVAVQPRTHGISTGHNDVPLVPAPDKLDVVFSCPKKTNVIQTDRATLWAGDAKLIDFFSRGKKWTSDVFPEWVCKEYAATDDEFLPKVRRVQRIPIL